MARENDNIEKILQETLNKVVDGLPDGREKSLVITKLHEAMFWNRATQWLPEIAKKSK